MNLTLTIILMMHFYVLIIVIRLYSFLLFFFIHKIHVPKRDVYNKIIHRRFLTTFIYPTIKKNAVIISVTNYNLLGTYNVKI